MQRTVLPASKTENQCSGRRRLHRKLKINAADGAACIEN
jgi:hypothetical protein